MNYSLAPILVLTLAFLLPFSVLADEDEDTHASLRAGEIRRCSADARRLSNNWAHNQGELRRAFTSETSTADQVAIDEMYDNFFDSTKSRLLTAQERNVIERVLSGHPVAQIAEDLGLSGGRIRGIIKSASARLQERSVTHGRRNEPLPNASELGKADWVKAQMAQRNMMVEDFAQLGGIGEGVLQEIRSLLAGNYNDTPVGIKAAQKVRLYLEKHPKPVRSQPASKRLDDTFKSWTDRELTERGWDFRAMEIVGDIQLVAAAQVRAGIKTEESWEIGSRLHTVYRIESVFQDFPPGKPSGAPQPGEELSTWISRELQARHGDTPATATATFLKTVEGPTRQEVVQALKDRQWAKPPSRKALVAMARYFRETPLETAPGGE